MQATLLADAFYLWALTANRTLALQGNISDGDALCANAKGTFDGKFVWNNLKLKEVCN
jgi:hypothetical protein